MRRRDMLKFATVAGLASHEVVATAQTSWPDRPVRLLVAQPAGSGVDAVARLLSDFFAKSWKQSVVVENKPGAQNILGAQTAARAPADGYTIYLGTAAALVSNAFLFKSLPYDPLKDFSPIGFVGYSPFAVVVSQSSPITSLDDFVARAKANPGKLSVANDGPRAFSGITARLFNQRAKINTNLVGYASGNVAIQDLIGGHADVLFSDLASVAALAKQGRVRVIAVTSPKRVPGWDVPAIAEMLPGFDMVGWFSLVAPQGTPADIIRRINKDLSLALEDKSLTDKVHAIGPVTPGAGTPEQTDRFHRAEHRKWAELSAELSVVPE